MRNIANPTEFRTNISNKLNAIIEDDTLCVNVERGVFNYSLKEASSKKIIKKWENPRFVQIYLDRLRSIYINLKDTSFLNRIKNGEVTPLNIASMTHQEMNPFTMEHFNRTESNARRKQIHQQYTSVN